MKTLRILLAAILLPLCSAPAQLPTTTSQPVTLDRSTNRLQQSTIKLPSGSTLQGESGSTLTISGGLSGTPSGGTLNLGSVTLSNIAASGVSFTNSGTGAVAVTLDAWLKSRQVSVKDFGATGDGTTDDTTAIQNAVNTGKWVVFPPGDYKITSTIGVFTDGQIIQGAGITPSDNSRGTRLHYTGTTGAAIQFPKAFRIASVSTHATTPTVTTAAAHGLTTGDIVLLDATTGSTATPALNGGYFVVTVTGSTTFTIQQNPSGSVNVSVAPDANTGEGSKYLIRHSGLSGMRITGDGVSNPTQGVKLGLGRNGTTASYTVNTWTGADLLVEGFGTGVDNYGSDGSALTGSAIYGNNTGVRTNSNDAFSAFNTDVSDSAIAWHVTGLGARLTIFGGVTSNNDLHGKLEEGARVKADSVWFEGSRDGEEGGWYMSNNSAANFVSCHRQITDALPFLYAGIVRANFIDCDLDMDYTAASGSVITGHGQRGLVNGQPHTASAYVADPVAALTSGRVKSWTLDWTNWDNRVTGGGYGGSYPPYHALSIGTSNATGSTSLARSTHVDNGFIQFFEPGASIGSDTINFSTRLRVMAQLYFPNSTSFDADTVFRIQIGEGYNTTSVGNLSDKGFGVRLDNTTWKGLCHNGSSLTTTTLAGAAAAAANTGYALCLDYDGAGTLTVYINGVNVGTVTGGPTGAGGAFKNAIIFSVSNGAGTVNQVCRIVNLWTVVGNP